MINQRYYKLHYNKPASPHPNKPAGNSAVHCGLVCNTPSRRSPLSCPRLSRPALHASMPPHLLPPQPLPIKLPSLPLPPAHLSLAQLPDPLPLKPLQPLRGVPPLTAMRVHSCHHTHRKGKSLQENVVDKAWRLPAEGLEQNIRPAATCMQATASIP